MEQRFWSLEQQFDLPAQAVYAHDGDSRQLRSFQGGENPDDFPSTGARGDGAGRNPSNALRQIPGFVTFGHSWGYRYDDLVFRRLPGLKRAITWA